MVYVIRDLDKYCKNGNHVYPPHRNFLEFSCKPRTCPNTLLGSAAGLRLLPARFHTGTVIILPCMSTMMMSSLRDPGTFTVVEKIYFTIPTKIPLYARKLPILCLHGLRPAPRSIAVQPCFRRTRLCSSRIIIIEETDGHFCPKLYDCFDVPVV